MAATTALPQVAKIKLDGAALSDAIAQTLIEVRVDQVVSSANRALFRFSDGDFKLLDSGKFKVAGKIEVSFSNPAGAAVTVFKGEITVISIEQTSNSRHELVLEAYDKSHRLGRDNVPTTFLNMSYGDAVSQLAQAAGLTADVGAPLSSGHHPYLVKSGTSMEFFNQIAHRTGTHWYVDSDDKVVFKQRVAGSAAFTVKYGESLIRFKARFSEIGHAKSVSVRSWDYANKKLISSEDSTELTSPTGGSSLSSISSMRNGYSSAQGKLVVGTTGAKTDAEAMQLAKAIGRRQSINELTARGEVIGDPRFKAGMTVGIQNVGETMSGDYYLTRVEHIFGRGGDLITRFTAGGMDNSSIVDLLEGSQPTTMPWSRSGVVIGVVTNNDDTAAPDGALGRVKVKFPSLSDSDESAWARVVGIGAGTERGMHFMPATNDEVLVAFEQGDPSRPIVLGGLYNGKDKPWAANADAVNGGKATQWGIKTTSGHILKFLDGSSDDKDGVTIAHSDGTTLLKLCKDMVQLISNSKPLEIKSGEASIVLKDGNITIKATKVTIESTADLALKAGAKLDVKATAGTAVAGGPTVEIKADGQLSVKSGGILELKGSLTKIN